jgi:hypothetical protein
MFAWAEACEHFDQNPFRRGNSTLIKPEQEDNRRHRRLTLDEEHRLMAQAADANSAEDRNLESGVSDGD